MNLSCRIIVVVSASFATRISKLFSHRSIISFIKKTFLSLPDKFAPLNSAGSYLQKQNFFNIPLKPLKNSIHFQEVGDQTYQSHKTLFQNSNFLMVLKNVIRKFFKILKILFLRITFCYNRWYYFRFEIIKHILNLFKHLTTPAK